LRVDLISSSCPSPLYFRADAAFANPELYELLEAEDMGYAIRLPVNRVLVARSGPNPPLAYGPVASSIRICRRRRVWIDHMPSRAHPAGAAGWGKAEILAAQPEPLQGSTLLHHALGQLLMHDFLLFVNNMRFIAYFARYILLLLGLIWIMLTVIFAWAEDQTLGNAIYFALITALTVGYGDITPVTPIGKAASAAIAVVGVITAGIYVGIATRAVSMSLRGHRLARDSRPGQYDVE
jgi:voltage-gated potassium channel